MRRHLPLFFGYFFVMALSNAIVPVLPAYSADPSVHGLIYAGYFFGAFVITLPAGILADQYGRIPFVRLGLFVSLASGIFLAGATDPVLVIAGRFLEGAGAGLFVAAAMAMVNADPDHLRLSGWLMASQNAGLVTGLAVAGWLAVNRETPAAGIALFSLLLLVPALASLLVREPPMSGNAARPAMMTGRVLPLAKEHVWLWYSTVVLIGITGIATALYPEFSGASSDRIGIWIAMMSASTAIAVLICSRMAPDPIPAIRGSAVLMAAGILLLFRSPAGFLVIGAVAGIVIISQMAYLAGTQEHQGTIMGLYGSFAYLGMAVLPAAAGYLAGGPGFPAAFILTALAALSVAATIGRCSCFRAGETATIAPGQENEQ